MATETYSVAQWLHHAETTFLTNGITDSPRLDAQLIVCDVLGISRTHLYAFPETIIGENKLAALNSCMHRRANGEPVAYICGKREFWSMDLNVNHGTLVPRADTEILVEQAIEWNQHAPAGPVLDLGTGSGAIAIALATELPARLLVAIERSGDAIAVANKNINRHAKGKICLIQGSWLDSLAENSMGMIVSNPPYLGNTDTHLASLTHEPVDALVSGTTGMEDLEHIIKHSARVAKPGAPLLLEHGSEQGANVRQSLQAHNFAQVATVRDLAGLERVSYGVNAKPDV